MKIQTEKLKKDLKNTVIGGSIGLGISQVLLKTVEYLQKTNPLNWKAANKTELYIGYFFLILFSIPVLLFSVLLILKAQKRYLESENQ